MPPDPTLTSHDPAAFVLHIPLLSVEVIRSYSNPNPQLDAAIDSMTAPSEPQTTASGPSWQPRPDCDPSVANNLPLPQPHALSRRLTADERREIAVAFSNGISQQELALAHGISIRSVKRLVKAARNAGVIGSQQEATWRSR